MKVSVCIPTYKRPERMLEALESCLSQSYLPFEILIGDDSPDNLTQNALNKIKIDPAIELRYFRNIPSLGQADNVNNLIQKCQGDTFLLLHDDDLLLENCLETLKYCFDQHPSIDVAYGKQYIMNDGGQTIEADSIEFNSDFLRTKKFEGSVLTSLEASIVQQFPNNAFLMRTDLGQSLKYKNVGPECDFDFGLRAGKMGYKFYFVDIYTAKYRISEISISNSQHFAALNAYITVQNTNVPKSSKQYKDFWMKKRAVIAMREAIYNKKYSVAKKIFFSSHHLKNLFTLGGVKNTLLLLMNGPRYFLEKSSREKDQY